MQLRPVGEDKILAQCHSGSEEELYLLDRTPVGELPEKELVVLASLSPGEELRKAVVEFIPTNANNCRLHSITSERIGNPELKAAFKCVHEYNRQGEKYHCVIEQYGAGTGTEDTGADLRLDAALLSAPPPD